MTTLAELVREIEADQVLEACRALRLDAEEAAAVLAMHRARPFLLELVHVHGGDARSFVAARVEIRRAIRSPPLSRAPDPPNHTSPRPFPSGPPGAFR